MRLYLIRHAETIANQEKRYFGHSDSSFTEMGKKQCRENIKTLSDFNIDAIYTSPSKRCLLQANILADTKSLKPLIDDRIMELNFGVFEGLTWQQAKEKHENEFKKWTENPYEYVLPNGEAQKDLDARINTFICEIKKSNYKIAAVFSHGGAIMSMISNLLKLDASQKWRFKISPGSIITIDIKDDYAFLVL